MQQHTNNTHQQYTQQTKMAAHKGTSPSRQLLFYPIINAEAFKSTIVNYRVFTHVFNSELLPGYNLEIEQYNTLVEEHNKSIKATTTKIKEATNLFKLELISYYGRGMKSVSEYNEIVSEFNYNHKIKVPKKKYTKVAYATAEIFACILGHCSYKLKSRNLKHLQLKQQTVFNPNEGFFFEITAHSLTNLKISLEALEIDVPKLDVCNKTIRNHIKRLMDCNVITDYNFRGYQKASIIKINPKVLTILDGHKPYQKTMANDGFGKGLLINNSSYRTLNNKKDNTQTAKADMPTQEELEALKQVYAMLSDSASTSAPNSKQPHIYRTNTQQPKESVEQLEQKRKKVPPKKEKEPRPLFKRMQKLMDMEVYEAATLLANGKMDYYSPLTINNLTQEANVGTITKTDFRKIVLYDFAFTTAQLWKDHEKPVWIGEWLNALQRLKDDYFLIRYNGEKYTPHKTTIIKQLKEVRWRVKEARKYCKSNPEYNLLFPNAYFDITNKDKSSGGFGYTKEFYRRHLEKLKLKAVKQQESLKKAKQRELNNKILVKVKQYINRRITLNQLYNYVAYLEKKNNRDKGYYLNILNSTLQKEQSKQ